jgi:hypothetical protein
MSRRGVEGSEQCDAPATVFRLQMQEAEEDGRNREMIGGDHAPTSAHVDTVPALGAPPAAYTVLAVACVTNQSMLALNVE